MSKNNFSEQGTVHLFLPLVGVLAIILVAVSGNIQTTTKFSDDQQVQGVLIAKDEDSNDSSSNKGKSEEHRTGENSGPSSNTLTTEENRGRGGPSQTNQPRQKQEIKNQEAETEVENEEEEATPSASPSNLENRLRSISKFPLRIDTETNQLIMIKGGVERVLTILPEKAVQNMLRAHLKKGLGPKFFGAGGPSATPSASATPISTSSAEGIVTEASTDILVLENQIELEEKEGKPVYKIPARKHLKLFGFIPTTTQFTDFISAETGNLIEEQQSILARFLDLLSP